MKHIFFDDTIFHTGPRGGIARYIVELGKALAGTGECQVTLFAGWSNSPYLDGLSNLPNFRLINCPRPAHWKINTLARNVSLLWRRHCFDQLARANPQIYHASYFDMDAKITAKAHAVVVTVYDMIAELYFDGKERSAAHLSQKFLASHRADAVFAISHSTRRDLERFHPWTEGKTHVTHLASNLGLPKSSISPPSVPIPERYFLMVGNRAHYKNGINGLKAYARIAKEDDTVALVLCGGEALNAEEESVLSNTGSPSRIIQLSAPDNQLAYLLSHAQGLLYPSLYEGFGLPVLEAMQLGCPVITTESSSIPEIGGDAVFYADPHSPESLAGVMRMLLLAPNELKHKIQKAQALAGKFSWERCARESLSVYKNLVPRNH